jgi:hypothetical protein
LSTYVLICAYTYFGYICTYMYFEYICTQSELHMCFESHEATAILGLCTDGIPMY